MIILILKLVFICVSLVMGATVITQEEMLLHSIRRWAETKNAVILEPLILCVWCMPSVYSIISILVAFGLGIIKVFSLKLIFVYILTVGCSSFCCGMLWLIYTLLFERYNYYFKINNPDNGNEEEQLD